MPEAKKVVRSVLLPSLQLTLGLFLIMKTTPLWAVIHCSIAYLLDCCHFPFTDYKQLRGFKGRVFKKVISHTTTAGDVSKVKKLKDPNRPKNLGRSVSVNYLGQRFVLERAAEKMQVKEGPAYYITDKMWETVLYIEKVASETVFVKNNKEIWEEVVTGDIMEFEEVLDAVILDNRAVVRLDHDYFLPVNLLLSEDKLRSTLNFVGIFLQTQKQVHWVISACLSVTAAVMGFSTTLRLSIAGWIGEVLCRGVQFLCDLLPYKTRRSVYSWCSWVERFKPSNDFHSRIVKGDVEVVIAGGAKFDSQCQIKRIDLDACLLSLVDERCCRSGGPFLFKCDPNCGSNCDSVYIEWIFDNSKCFLKVGRLASNETGSALVDGEAFIQCVDGDPSPEKSIKFLKASKSSEADTASVDIDSCKVKELLVADDIHTLVADDIHTASVDIDCSTELEAIKLFVFAYHMAELKSGSLKSYERKSGTVYVRRFVDSINAYVRSGYPPLYKLDRLENVVVR